MITSSNRNIFRATGPLRGEFTGHRWIPRTKASEALMFSLIYARISPWVNNRESSNLRRHRAHYDVIVMNNMKTTHTVLYFFVFIVVLVVLDSSGFRVTLVTLVKSYESPNVNETTLTNVYSHPMNPLLCHRYLICFTNSLFRLTLKTWIPRHYWSFFIGILGPVSI